jgi:hypothetical protein
MNRDPVLDKAARLLRFRDYQGAVRILEAEENRYYGSFKYNYLFGLTCLYLNEYGNALSFFKQARQIKVKDINTLLGLAALNMHKSNTNQAVDLYLDVQEIAPKNKIVKKALSIIRKYSEPDRLLEWLEAGNLKQLYPPIPPYRLHPRIIISGLVIALLAAAICFFSMVQLSVIKNPFAKQNPRSITELALSAQERKEPVELGGSYRYIVTRDQAINLYDDALSLFSSYHDEKAKIRLNQILESNASEGLKNKSRLLMTYMEMPGFDNFIRADNVSYSDVISEIHLYRDVYVIWKGMATNVNVDDENTRFDFLVGYDTRTTLEGIVPVLFNIPVSVNSERPLEVLGKIVLVGSDIRLDGVAIHQSGLLENK